MICVMEKAYTQRFIHQEGSFEFDAIRDRKTMEFSRGKSSLLCGTAEYVLYTYAQDSW